MKTRLIIYLLSSVVSCLAEKVEPLTLADIVRSADVIAIAKVDNVKVANANETFEYQHVTCTLTNVLKGKPVNNPTEIVLAIQLKTEPPPNRLLSNQSYLVFLTGDWSLKPVTPTGSIVPAANANENHRDVRPRDQDVPTHPGREVRGCRFGRVGQAASRAPDRGVVRISVL